VFDTNVLFTGSASDLVRQEAANLINQSRFPDLDIQWYLPNTVRLERQFQMQKAALDLLAPVARVEKLLGHNLNITSELLIARVEAAIEQRQKELGLITLTPEYPSIDWDRLVLDSAFRRPPFQDGKTEKGFRDALVVESFVHLVNTSPRTPKVCRVVLVSADSLVAEAVQVRIGGSANAAVLTSLEELSGLINTLVSQVDESFLASLRPKAASLFFVANDQSTLYYKERIRDRLKERFSAELSALPSGATQRKNGTWLLSQPNFSRKAGQRVHWKSRIEIETEASKTVQDPSPPAYGLSLSASPMNVSTPQGPFAASNFATYRSMLASSDVLTVGRSSWESALSTRNLITHKGKDVYDVLWSVNVTTALVLRQPTIDDLTHLDATWDAV